MNFLKLDKGGLVRNVNERFLGDSYNYTHPLLFASISCFLPKAQYLVFSPQAHTYKCELD